MLTLEQVIHEVDSAYSECRTGVFYWVRKLESGKVTIRDLMEKMNADTLYNAEEKASIALAIVTYQKMIHEDTIK